MTKEEENQALAALALVGVAAAIILMRPKLPRTGEPAAPGGPIMGTGAGIPGEGEAAPTPSEAPEGPGIIEQVVETATSWLQALVPQAHEGAIPYPAPQPERSPTEWRTLMRPTFRRLEKSYAMPTGFLEAIADRESRFRHDIVSGQLKGGVNETGVMQLHPQYHLSSDRERIDPNIAIPYAAKYLAQNYLKFGTWEEAIAAYNWGPGNLERSGLQNAPAATKEYIAWVKGRHYVEPFV